MKFHGQITWRKKYQTGIQRGILAIKPVEKFMKTLAIFLNKHEEVLTKLEYEGKELGEKELIDIILETHYKKRTLNQNSLYWALRTIQANELNGGRKGTDMITPEQLHDDYLQEYGEREVIKTQRKNLNYYRNKGRVEYIIIDQQKITVNQFLSGYEIAPERYITIQRIKGTSEKNTKEMAEVIEQVFDDIWQTGVDDPGKIHQYWMDFYQFLNNEKVILNDKKMTKDEYRQRKKMCEGCGVKPGIHIAHIKAKGMGGKEEEEKDHPLNWLHLCNDCHMDDIHTKGWDLFIKKFPHLRFKIEKAMKIVEETKEQGELF